MLVDAENWLPATIPAAAPVTPVAHRVDYFSAWFSDEPKHLNNWIKMGGRLKIE
jgi:hypothetical protein